MKDLSLLIEIKNISKSYPNINTAKQRLRSLYSIIFNKGNLKGIEVLRNINLKVYKGESLAIIGKNGAGKSTLLKIISGVIKATKGDVQVSGKIGALLELGSGFHPEYTGRENLKMSAAMAGMTKKDIINKINQMIKFADIGRYIDQPVKNYSSGMVVRLGFSVVTVTKPDLLITDEVLAVGDTDFQRKCIAWIDNYINNGGTLLLVSHSLYHVQKLCKHAIWLENGEIKKFGDSFLISQEYQNHYDDTAEITSINATDENITHITEFNILNVKKNKINTIESGEDIHLEIIIHSKNEEPPGLTLEIKRGEYPIYVTNSKNNIVNSKEIKDKEFLYQIKIPQNKLLPNKYRIIVHAMDNKCKNLYYKTEKSLKVTSKTHEMGVVILDTKWR